MAFALLVTLGIPSQAQARVTKTWTADFDQDGVEEKLLKVTGVRRIRRYREPTEQLIISDPGFRNGARIPVSPRVVHLAAAGSRLQTPGDAVPDIYWRGYSGGMSLRLAYFGVANWTGTGVRYLWRYTWKDFGDSSRYAGAEFEVKDNLPDWPGREIILYEKFIRRGEPLCCPSGERQSVFAYDPTSGTFIGVGEGEEQF
ncbi:MAG: hypothetical protein H0T15_03170 [Thermoleophilaceae bacterium]|nr:hypothetical protein [Thermoleophilaceae bacterium]